ncbi:MAG: 6-carboxytetrahydropterin synthase, partial [Anaerolineales bacterium]
SVTETVAELLALRTPAAASVRVWESPELFAMYERNGGRYQFGRRYRFHAAHSLFDPSISVAANRRRYGRCGTAASPHGHAYTALVAVEGQLDPVTDTVYNLTNLDGTAGALLSSFDGAYWSQSLPELGQGPATAELVAVIIWQRLAVLLGGGLVEFDLYETPNLRVQVKRGAYG